MLALILLLPLFVWGIFMPVTAAISHLTLTLFLEALAFAHLVLFCPIPNIPVQHSTLEQLLVARYHQFLRNPSGAVIMSHFYSAAGLWSIPWVGLLVWKGHWILAILIAANYFITSVLISILNPLPVLEKKALKHNVEAAAQFTALLSLYEERMRRLSGDQAGASLTCPKTTGEKARNDESHQPPLCPP